MNLRHIVRGLRKREKSRDFINFANISSTGANARDSLPEVVLRTENLATIAGIGPDKRMKAGNWQWGSIDQEEHFAVIEDSDETRSSSRDNSQCPLNVSSLHFIGG